MAGILKNVACGDGYTDAATLRDIWTAKGGSFRTANALTFYQVQYGHQGEDHWTPEIPLDPTIGEIHERATGIRFRNLTAGTIATVSAYIAEGNEPIIVASDHS